VSGDVSIPSLWATADLASKLALAGAASAVWGFFLTWVDIPNMASSFSSLLSQLGGGGGLFNGPPARIGGIVTASISGFTLAQAWGVVYVYPVLAIISALSLYLALQGRQRVKIIAANGWLILIGALVGPQSLLVLLFVPAIQKLVGIGFWMNSLGFCALLLAGLIGIRTQAEKLSHNM
jgi:hypothetical protein